VKGIVVVGVYGWKLDVAFPYSVGTLVAVDDEDDETAAADDTGAEEETAAADDTGAEDETAAADVAAGTDVAAATGIALVEKSGGRVTEFCRAQEAASSPLGQQ